MRSYLIPVVFRLLAALPLAALQVLGKGIGWLLWRVPNRERHYAQVNLALCFPELDAVQRERLLGRTLVANASTLVEIPKAWLRDSRYWLPRIEVATGVEAEIRRHLAQGKGLIYAAPHLGNWEVGLHFLTHMGPTTAFYRHPREPAVEGFMLGGRKLAGAKLAAISPQGIRLLYQALSAGEQVAVLPDQEPHEMGSAAAFAPFFGVPALTMTLLSRLARKTGAGVFFIFAARLPEGRYRMHGFTADPALVDRNPQRALAALNAELERCVRMFPEQYQWTYRRFKHAPPGRRNPYKASR